MNVQLWMILHAVCIYILYAFFSSVSSGDPRNVGRSSLKNGNSLDLNAGESGVLAIPTLSVLVFPPLSPPLGSPPRLLQPLLRPLLLLGSLPRTFLLSGSLLRSVQQLGSLLSSPQPLGSLPDVYLQCALQ